MTPSTTDAAVVHRLFNEVVNRGNLDLTREIIAQDAIIYTPHSPEPLRGPAPWAQVVGQLRTAFPDLHVTIEDLIEENDRVVTRLTACGSHLGDLMGIPPTGRTATWTVAHFQRLRDGYIIEDRVVADLLGLMIQLGVVSLPMPESPIAEPTWGESLPPTGSGSEPGIGSDRPTSTT